MSYREVEWVELTPLPSYRGSVYIIMRNNKLHLFVPPPQAGESVGCGEGERGPGCCWPTEVPGRPQVSLAEDINTDGSLSS